MANVPTIKETTQIILEEVRVQLENHQVPDVGPFEIKAELHFNGSGLPVGPSGEALLQAAIGLYCDPLGIEFRILDVDPHTKRTNPIDVYVSFRRR